MPTKNTPGRRKGAYTQAARVLAILEMVRTEGAPLPLARIAARFELSERQARRDVAMLVEAGHGLRTILLEGRSAVETTDAEGAVQLSARERVLLSSLAPLAAQLGQGALGDEVRAALHKLALPARLEVESPATVVAGPSQTASPATSERIDRIEAAIRDRLELRVRTAADPDDARLVALLPYLLVTHPSGLHVVARWEPGEPMRAVPVERLTHVELAPGTSVAAPQSIDVARLFEPSARGTSPQRLAMT